MLFLYISCLLISSVYAGCTQYAAVSSITTSVAYRATYTSGIWGSRRRDGTRSYTVYHTTYSTQLQCCSGYGPLPGCPPICSSCSGANQNCTSPNNCVCLSGWTGPSCNTDINECSLNTDQCDDPNGCINRPGTYKCRCTNANEQLASDGRRCLSQVRNIVTVPGRRNISLSWSPPIDYTADGVFRRYRITCHLGSQQVLTTYRTSRYVTMSPLLPFTNYSCCVTPEWTTGSGPVSCVNNDTLQDAPSDSPSVISVVMADSSSLLIEWAPPNTPNGIITNYTLYINYTNGSSIDIRTADSQYSLYLLEGLKPYQQVGVSMSATTIGGEGPQSDAIYNRTGQTEPGAVSTFEIDVLSSSSVNITWRDPTLLNGLILTFHINVRSLTVINQYVKTWDLSNDNSYHLTVTGLKPFVPYLMNIAAATVIGKGELNERIFFTEEREPSTSLQLTVNRQSATTALVRWIPLTLEESRGFPTNVTIIVAPVSSQICIKTAYNNEQVVNVSASVNQYLLKGLEPAQNYCISVYASTAGGRGEESTNFLSVNESRIFYLYISGMQDCRLWIETDSAEKLNDIVTLLTNELVQGCSCPITNQYFLNEHFDRCETDYAVFKTSIIGNITNNNSSQLVTIIQNWGMSQPSIIIHGVSLTVKSVCKLDPVTDETECVPSTQSTSSTTKNIYSSPVAIGGVSGVAILICIVIVGIMITVIILYIKRRHKYQPDQPENEWRNNANESYGKTNTSVEREDSLYSVIAT